ncbi:helix-turn-helix domain-containing protein [Tepidiforma bonchosmolovskayae]|uniref:Helix-turn-helix domain-containing protein n=1 Tax=Tepidiforma bonchosmolovskayae TaxID=2601677 RepID=A0ABX6C0J0_9CHLR|nr:helix-turn-helix domain-containing protein [Tepidiforma bonchosmolovskayae]QFG02178.1 helix-turn-helix domain-containing protein [Tepidiforma bonchosmolovskayae]
MMPVTPLTPDDVVAARRQLGLTQVELARALGVALTTLQRWELGLTRPPPYLRLALERLVEDKKFSPGSPKTP